MKPVGKIVLTLFYAFTGVLFLDGEALARRIDILSPEQYGDVEHSEEDDDEYDMTDDFYDLEYDPNSTINDEVKVWDPWEKMNRKIYNFNEFFLTYLAKPLYYEVYVKITTPGMRKSVHNIVANFRMPIIFANYILQLDFLNAAKALYSFTLNTTYGILGVFDVSGHQGVTPPVTDFGITLAKYYVPSGPYIVLPFLGPNDIRGTVGWAVEIAADPFDYNLFKIGGKRPLLDNWVIFARSGLYVIDNASYAVVNFYDLLKASFDPYVMMRDAYGQSQVYKIKQARGD